MMHTGADSKLFGSPTKTFGRAAIFFRLTQRDGARVPGIGESRIYF